MFDEITTNQLPTDLDWRKADSDDISRAKIMLEGRMESGRYVPAYLESVTVQQFGDLRELHPIVVLNACQAGRLGSQLTSIGGFAKAFLEAVQASLRAVFGRWEMMSRDVS